MRIILAVCLLAVAIPVAFAEGAIAFGKLKSPTYNNAVVSFGYNTRREARAAAIADCTKHAADCRIEHEFRNVCVAVAQVWSGPSVGFGPTEAAARTDAERTCSFMHCRATFSKCDTIAETAVAPKVISQREPTQQQQKAIDHLHEIAGNAVKDAVIEVFIGLVLGAFYGWLAGLGRGGKVLLHSRYSTRHAVIGALSSAALVVAYDLTQGNFAPALMRWFEYSLEWMMNQFSLLALILALPWTLFFMAASISLFAGAFIGAAFAIVGGVMNIANFIRGLHILWTYILGGRHR